MYCLRAETPNHQVNLNQVLSNTLVDHLTRGTRHFCTTVGKGGMKARVVAQEENR